MGFKERLQNELYETMQIAQNSDGDTYTNALNKLGMLNIMVLRFEDDNGRGFYDDESDFDIVYDNLVDEILEMQMSYATDYVCENCGIGIVSNDNLNREKDGSILCNVCRGKN
jgi:hypothetical protein